MNIGSGKLYNFLAYIGESNEKNFNKLFKKSI